MSTSVSKRYHRGDLPQALVGAALDLLCQDGAEAISLRAVARRAGVSAMAPYRHYEDKEALLAAVAALGFERFREALIAADAAAPAGQALVAQAQAYVRFAMDNPALFRLMFGPMDLGLHPDLCAAGEAAYAVLAQRVAADTPTEADRDARALGCWSLVHGLAMLMLDGRVRGKMPASIDDVTRRVAEAMLGHGAG
jgi:AcrR family transcriptional regulator